MHIDGHISMCKEIYYKKLVHVITETKKFQDLQLASWDLRTADGVMEGEIPF